MFVRLHDAQARVEIAIDGRTVLACAGDTVAATMLQAGISTFRRTALSGSARSAYCGMGVCFDCLVTIDGAANRQACLIPVRAGMVIETGRGVPDLAAGAAP